MVLLVASYNLGELETFAGSLALRASLSIHLKKERKKEHDALHAAL